MQNYRLQRTWEWATWGAMLTSGTLAMGWAALWPVPIPEPDTSQSNLPRALGTTADLQVSDPANQSDWTKRLSERRLQDWASARPTVASSPVLVPQTSSTAQGPLAGLHLTGTVIEPGRSFAMFVDKTGSMDLKPVGGTLRLQPTGVRIDSIMPRSAVVSFEGHTHQLEINALAAAPFLRSPCGDANSATQSPSPPIGTQPSSMQSESSMQEVDSTELTPFEEELDSLNGIPSESLMEQPQMVPAMNPQMGAAP